MAGRKVPFFWLKVTLFLYRDEEWMAKSFFCDECLNFKIPVIERNTIAD